MDNSEIKKKLRLIIEKNLRGKLSKINMSLIEKIFEEEVVKNNNIEHAISKIKIAIKLFVDEKMAEDVSREMKQLTGS